MTRSLEEAMQDAGGPVELLWNSQTPPSVVPRVVPEFTNWRSEQLAWQQTCVLFDQSHHMVDLAIEGPDALTLLSKLGVNKFENFPVNKAKQFVACNHDGYLIGDAILFHLAEQKFLLVGIVPVMDWVEYHLATGDYDVHYDRDDNSLNRVGDPKRYRYEVQGPNAMAVVHDILGTEPPELKFFNMTEMTIAGRTVTALRHGMAGEPGYELFGPWEDNDAVLAALLEAGKKHDMHRVGGSAYHTNALESGWLPRPLPAIYTDDRLAGYRQWLSDRSYEAASPLGGSFASGDVTDYYLTPFDLDYGRIVNFEHDFIGREALEKMKASGRDTAKSKVTLVWNGDDVGQVTGTMFQPGLGAKFIKLPMSMYATFQYDAVQSPEGSPIGVSTWTGYSANAQAMLSLAVVDSDYATPGTEVTVVWGESPNSAKAQVEPHRQVRLRATVQPAPLTEYARTGYRSNA